MVDLLDGMMTSISQDKAAVADEGRRAGLDSCPSPLIRAGVDAWGYLQASLL